MLFGGEGDSRDFKVRRCDFKEGLCEVSVRRWDFKKVRELKGERISQRLLGLWVGGGCEKMLHFTD